jgi:hypothetical protein
MRRSLRVPVKKPQNRASSCKLQGEDKHNALYFIAFLATPAELPKL